MGSSGLAGLPFLKMHGIGNDFVLIDCLRDGAPTEAAIQAASPWLCDRRFGVGGDGVILALRGLDNPNHFRMRMFNPDGSEAEMCGNGIRCLGKFLCDFGYTAQTQLPVETLAGLLTLQLTVEAGTATQVTVDMGEPRLTRAEIPMTGVGDIRDVPVEVDGTTLRVTAVSMGNPHAIFFAEDVTDALINRFGPPLELHPLFPARTNVHAIQVISSDEVRMLTWERGAGRTLACGTGACGSVVASVLNGHTNRTVHVHLAGGDLRIEWRESDNHVYMTGPAETVYSGTLNV